MTNIIDSALVDINVGKLEDSVSLTDALNVGSVGASASLDCAQQSEGGKLGIFSSAATPDPDASYSFGIKDSKTLATFILSSLSGSKRCDYDGGLKIDLQSYLSVRKVVGQIPGSNAVRQSDINLEMLKDTELIMQNAFTTYNKNHPRHKQLTMHVDDNNPAIFTLDQKLTPEQTRDLMRYVHSSSIEEIIEDKNENKNLAMSKIGALQL